MKTKIYPNLAITLVVIFSISCNKIIKDDDSLIFSVHYSGGWTSIDETLTINSDTTHYSRSYFDIYNIRETVERKSYQTTIKTPDGQWDRLTKAFNLEAFAKIRNGSCRACVDGVDETFSATKNGETYSFYNGIADEHYQQMQGFFDSIYEQLETFRNNAEYK